MITIRYIFVWQTQYYKDCLLMMDRLPIEVKEHVTFLYAGLVLTLVDSVDGYAGSKVAGSFASRTLIVV